MNERDLQGVLHALRSYQYGNASPDLAKSWADQIEAELESARSHVERSDPDICSVCGLFKRAPGVSGDACPGHKPRAVAPSKYALTPTGNPLTDGEIEEWRKELGKLGLNGPSGGNVLCDMAKAALRPHVADSEPLRRIVARIDAWAAEAKPGGASDALMAVGQIAKAALESPRSATPRTEGLRAAMRAIEKHRDDYAHENGMVDPTTNAYEARQAVMDRIEALDDAIEIINKLVKKEAAK